MKDKHSDWNATSQIAKPVKRGAKAKPLSEIDVEAGFPGSHAMGLPLKEAVEKFIRLKFGNKVDEPMMRQDVVKHRNGIDHKLERALDSYRQEFGCLPFKILSKHDNAKLRLKKVLAMLSEESPMVSEKPSRRDRDSALMILKRIMATPDPKQ